MISRQTFQAQNQQTSVLAHMMSATETPSHEEETFEKAEKALCTLNLLIVPGFRLI